MDFDQTVAAHSKWKRTLREYVAKPDGSLSPANVSLDDKCTLGEWIYSTGAKHSALPEYVKLKYEHARFHTAAAEIVRKANAGESVADEVAPCSNSEFSSASSAIVMALMSLKNRLSKTKAAGG